MAQFSATAYSPRLVRWVARTPLVSHAIGVFAATFLYAIILCIGFIMAGIRTDKRALHDLLAGTRVIRL